MNRRVTLLLFAAIAISAASVPVVAQRTGPAQPPKAPGEIRGMVRDAATLKGVAYARVILEVEREGYLTETATDAGGRFIFSQLPHKVFVVRIKQPGYKYTDQATATCFASTCRRTDLTMSSSDNLSFDLVPLPVETTPAVPPGGPGASINVAELQIPEPARKEFDKGIEIADAGKNPEESIGHFKKAIEIYPSYDQAYFRMGLVYADSKRFKDAEAALTKATQLNGNNGGAFLALGSAYAAEKDFAAAEQPMARGLDLNPNVAEAQCELSRVYWALRKFAESDQRAQKCASLKPDYPPAHLLLGNLALAKRDKAGALREYKEYVRLDPQGPFAAPARDQVSRLEKELGQAK